MFRRLISVLTLAAYVLALGAAAPHAHGSSGSGGPSHGKAAGPHVHLASGPEDDEVSGFDPSGHGLSHSHHGHSHPHAPERPSLGESPSQDGAAVPGFCVAPLQHDADAVYLPELTTPSARAWGEGGDCLATPVGDLPPWGPAYLAAMTPQPAASGRDTSPPGRGCALIIVLRTLRI